MSAYFFLHCPSGRSFPTTDPYQWLLHHRDSELLAAARERLLLSSEDSVRGLRAATRRCDLALVHVVTANKIVVEHWSDPPPDLRAFAKVNRIARAGIQVVFVNTKNGKVVVHENAEDLLLFGVRVGLSFPWSEYIAKHERRHVEETDDADAAPAAYTNFVWAGSPHERLTWRVLKSIWMTERVGCPNCDVPMLLTSVGWHKSMLSFRSAHLHRHCPRCRRRFEAAEEKPLAWLASVLPPALRPTHLEQWRRFEINWERLTFKHERPVQCVDRKE